ncbi:hypothetical protein BaRGS_00004076 [Batillaria attramentaria]|uniref:Uncharacterized protein n=1 Tax=Batillaria attramentaria TaxID=370345 RepID=A0ABD0LY63_9CAEN
MRPASVRWTGSSCHLSPCLSDGCRASRCLGPPTSRALGAPGVAIETALSPEHATQDQGALEGGGGVEGRGGSQSWASRDDRLDRPSCAKRYVHPYTTETKRKGHVLFKN